MSILSAAADLLPKAFIACLSFDCQCMGHHDGKVAWHRQVIIQLAGCDVIMMTKCVCVYIY